MGTPGPLGLRGDVLSRFCILTCNDFSLILSIYHGSKRAVSFAHLTLSERRGRHVTRMHHLFLVRLEKGGAQQRSIVNDTSSFGIAFDFASPNAPSQSDGIKLTY